MLHYVKRTPNRNSATLGSSISSQGTLWRVILDPGSKILLAPADSIRLATLVGSSIKDGSGNLPGTGNWRVKVEGDPRKPPSTLTLT